MSKIAHMFRFLFRGLLTRSRQFVLRGLKGEKSPKTGRFGLGYLVTVAGVFSLISTYVHDTRENYLPPRDLFCSAMRMFVSCSTLECITPFKPSRFWPYFRSLAGQKTLRSGPPSRK